MRPKQWTKNVFVFAGVVFSRSLLNPAAMAKSLLAFTYFCMASSAVYLINDVVDIEGDRIHPSKRNRPIASGRLRPGLAVGAAIGLVTVSLALAFWLDLIFGLVLLAYFGLMVAYSFYLKNVVILDVFALAFGFVLRAAGGALAIQVAISPWLLVCMLLLALFLGLAKRRHELILLNNDASRHRRILQEYSPALLEEMVSVVTASTVMAYSLYTVFAPNLPKEPYPYMMFTIPFVIYAVFRYLYLVYQKDGGGSPEEILLRDLPFLFNLLLWGGVVLVILYLFPTA
ncbi:MAG: decaprenyl-phosphate phosphoribosyltransferase [Chloroflexia bacterium]|nr:decaprenyl-phosphate phosphoribosyltransferase [Chloroflexia bacterium]